MPSSSKASSIPPPLPPILQAFPSSAFAGIDRALGAIRAHLGLDVAFVSEFADDVRTFRHVDARGIAPIRIGDRMSMSEGYCRKIVEGHLPQLIPDTAQVPAAMAIAATHDLPIGSHLSVPLVMSDGRVYGTFCCFSYLPDHSLNERDLQMMSAFAELVAWQIESDIETGRTRSAARNRIETVLRSGEPRMVYQPITLLSDMSTVGAEALARFSAEPVRPPDQWFAEAGTVGLKRDLELKAIRDALAPYRDVWRRGRLYLGLNVSPQTLVEGGVAEAIAGYPAQDIVLEITEHEHIEDYAVLAAALAPIRATGVHVAIDDAGSGYASMRHIINIAPDLIKLDVSLTRGIDADPMKRALASALIAFGRQTNCKLLAEGVETEAETRTLRDLGVNAAQGYHFGRPMPFDTFLAGLPATVSVPGQMGLRI